MVVKWLSAGWSPCGTPVIRCSWPEAILSVFKYVKGRCLFLGYIEKALKEVSGFGDQVNRVGIGIKLVRQTFDPPTAAPFYYCNSKYFYL
jgi:hypothetical protein